MFLVPAFSKAIHHSVSCTNGRRLKTEPYQAGPRKEPTGRGRQVLLTQLTACAAHRNHERNLAGWKGSQDKAAGASSANGTYPMLPLLASLCSSPLAQLTAIMGGCVKEHAFQLHLVRLRVASRSSSPQRQHTAVGACFLAQAYASLSLAAHRMCSSPQSREYVPFKLFIRSRRNCSKVAEARLS